MRFRLAFALAMRLPHEVLLCDEAFSAADAEYRRHAYAEMRRRLGGGEAVLVATHDRSVEMALADRAVHREGGRVVRERPAAKVLQTHEESGSGEA